MPITNEGKQICDGCGKNIDEQLGGDMCPECGRLYCSECEPDNEIRYVVVHPEAHGRSMCKICREAWQKKARGPVTLDGYL